MAQLARVLLPSRFVFEPYSDPSTLISKFLSVRSPVLCNRSPHRPLAHGDGQEKVKNLVTFLILIIKGLPTSCFKIVLELDLAILIP